MSANEAQASILWCDLDGGILTLLMDDLALNSVFAVGCRFDERVSAVDRALAQAFLGDVRRHGAAFDRAISVDAAAGSLLFRFEGSRVDQQLLITIRDPANIGFRQSHAVLDAMAGLNNRLVNRHRELARALAGVARLAGLGPENLSDPPPPQPSPQPSPQLPPSGGDRHGFSQREQDVVTLLLDGYGNRPIAEKLAIEESAVKARLRTIYRKLGVASRAQAIMALLAAKKAPRAL
jgi:DNA-binding CsgD family transcriptional regulator